MKKYIPLVLAIAVALGMASLAYIQAGKNGFREYAATLSTLDGLLVLNGSIDREISLILGGQSVAFDRLTDLSTRLSPFTSGLADDDKLTNSVRAKAADLERFKTTVAVYRNAVRNSSHLSNKLNNITLFDSLNSSQRDALINLDAALISGALLKDQFSLAELKDTTTQARNVDFPADLNRQWHAMIRHTELTVSSAIEISGLSALILNARLPKEVARVRSLAEQTRSERAETAHYWRLFLLLITVVLVGLLLRAGYLAVTHSRELQTLNAELEQRVLERTEVLEKTSTNLSESLEENRRQQRSLVRLSEAVSEAAEGIMILGVDQTVVFCNAAYARSFGFDPAALQGEKHPPSQHISRILAMSKHHEVGRVEHFDLTITQPSGEDMVAEFSTATMQDSGSGALEYLVIVKDVTERRNLETQLAQAQKLESIGQLAAGIAHEINTPAQYVTNNVHFFEETWGDLQPLLNVFQTQADPDDRAALWDEADGDYLLEEVPSALAQAKVGLDQIKNIVMAMKNFAHPGAEGKEAIDLNAALQDTITIAKSEWKYVADLQTDLDETLPPVPAARSALNQVWLNLLVNASHAIADVVGDTGNKGLIKVTSRQIDDYVEVTVEDSGCGMPAEIRNRIFDPFFTTKGVGKGSGQGLAIAYNVIVDQHGGTIAVSSEPGTGTVFTVRVPLLESDQMGEAGREVVA